MTLHEQVFKRRHDIYYITLLVYVAFLALYIVVTGTITDDSVKFGFKDPVVYIVGIFIVHALFMLLVSVVRNRRLVLTPEAMVFRSRFIERSIPYSDIERITLKRQLRSAENESVWSTQGGSHPRGQLRTRERALPDAQEAQGRNSERRVGGRATDRGNTGTTT